MGSVTCVPPSLPSSRALLSAPVALAKSGLLRPYRPDRVMRIGAGLLRYGTGPGFGPLAGATLCPERLAIIDDDGALTFGQLEERCEAFAARLRLVASAGDTVALLGRNSAGFYQTMVAATRRGMDVLYLNTGLSASQIAEIVTRRGVRLLVHDAEFAGRAPPGLTSIPVPGHDPPSHTRITASGRRQPRPARSRSRHIMLTSGTTGRPKSVPRTVGGAASVISVVSGLPNRAWETSLIAAPMFHAWGFLNTVLTMLFGSTIVLTRGFDPQRTLGLVERERCNVLVAVPTMLRRIMDLPPDIRRRHDTSSLRAVTVSGSALAPALSDGFMNEFGDVVYNLYGSTEAGYAAVAKPADLRAAPGTAGRPLPLVDVRILNADGSPCPPGVRGMIWVSSRDSIAIAEDDKSSHGAVRTGDIGWLDEAGRLFVAGRADDMIITAGENVYPTEVETVLEQHPGVLEAAVIAIPDELYGQILSAHLVLRDRGAVTPDALRSWCRERLAAFQIPKRFTIHDKLPHNAAGKVRKRDLKDSS